MKFVLNLNSVFLQGAQIAKVNIWSAYICHFDIFFPEYSSRVWIWLKHNLCTKCANLPAVYLGRLLNPFASEAVYTRNFFSDRMSDSV